MSEGLEIIEQIDDLRKERRAVLFWKCCSPRVECIQDVIAVGERPKCRYQYTLKPSEAIQMWELWQQFKERPYEERSGQEIMVDADTWGPIDGVHRAAVLYALERKVPAVLVRKPKPSKVEWIFEDIWKPER